MSCSGDRLMKETTAVQIRHGDDVPTCSNFFYDFTVVAMVTVAVLLGLLGSPRYVRYAYSS